MFLVRQPEVARVYEDPQVSRMPAPDAAVWGYGVCRSSRRDSKVDTPVSFLLSLSESIDLLHVDYHTSSHSIQGIIRVTLVRTFAYTLVRTSGC